MLDVSTGWIYRETSFRQFGYIDRLVRVACDGNRNFNPSKCGVMWMTRKKKSDPEDNTLKGETLKNVESATYK